MIYWAQLLHFYQPPSQLHFVLTQVYQESYRSVIEVLRQNPHVRLTVNINAVLTEMLHDHGMSDVVDGLKDLAERGQIEFTGSGKYHPILPLLPGDEVERQIGLNKTTNTALLGPAFNPGGFFPPEMAYSQGIVPSVVRSGHRWIIVSGVACPLDWPVDFIYETEVEGQRIALVLRDDIVSLGIGYQGLNAQGFFERLGWLKGSRENIYVVTALDAETFGHHIPNWENTFLSRVYGALQSPEFAGRVKAVSISELLDLFPRGRTIEAKKSSWSTSGDDLANDNPYPLWLGKGNEVHALQWAHLAICKEMVDVAERYLNTDESRHYWGIARSMLDIASHSCQFWWASQRPWWDVNMINRGLAEQHEAILNAFRAISCDNLPADIVQERYRRATEARQIREKILDMLLFGACKAA